MQQVIITKSLMNNFATSTGLYNDSSEKHRYLWTDAFAVCNYLELYHQTAEKIFLQLALKLVDQVHQTLGQHRMDSAHSGWISGLDEKEGQQHPTKGGLRIGKQLNERQPGESVDEALEWQRDGQYFHYLTKWMHALNRISQVTSKSIYNRWALELAKATHSAFTYVSSTDGRKRMVWKMSIDLSRPLIDSMGQHDPLDGLITYQQLETTAKKFSETSPELSLKNEITDMAIMCEESNWHTEDALGIGGLLTDTYKLIQLINIYNLYEIVKVEELLHIIKDSLEIFIIQKSLHVPAEYRLAFRELGLSIGLQTISRMRNSIEKQPEHFTNAKKLLIMLKNLSRFYYINELIKNFWADSGNQSTKLWKEHANINNVMLATSLAPDGYLQL